MTDEFEIRGLIDRADELLDRSKSDNQKAPEDRGVHDARVLLSEYGLLTQHIGDCDGNSLADVVHPVVFALLGLHQPNQRVQLIAGVTEGYASNHQESECLPGHGVKSVFLYFFEFILESRNDGEDVTDDPVVRDLENRGFSIGVDRDDDFRSSHTRQVLDGAADSASDI